MLCGNVNFREIHRRLILVKDDRAINDLKSRIHFPENSDSLLMFCYIDTEAGLTFEFLCTYNSQKNEYYERDIKELRQIYRKGFFNNCEIEIIPDNILKSKFLNEYINSIIDNYENDENKIFTRKIKDIDHLRENDFPDDILVYIYKEGLNTERVWVRLSKVENGKLYGLLQNEPNSNFGIHLFNEIKIEIFKDEEGKINTIYVCE